jgi:hypothetical protein
MIFFLRFCWAFWNDKMLERSIESTIEKMQQGVKFSAVVDVRKFVQEFPGSQSLIEFLDSVELAPDDCYMRVVNRLQIDCDHAKVSLLDKMSLEFTRCYFEVLGQGHKIPLIEGGTVQDYTSTMSGAVYVQFNAIRNHAVSLCHYARQNIINADITRHLVGLFESVLSSQQTAQEMNATLGATWRTVNRSVADLQDKIIEGDKFIRNITDQVVGLTKLVNETFETLKKPAKHIEVLKEVALGLIVVLLLGLFLPSFLVPLIGLTLARWALNFVAAKYIADWDDFRWVSNLAYGAIAAGYPGYRLVGVVTTATSLFLRASNLRPEPIVSFPRIGPAPSGRSLGRPRAY